MTTKTFDGFLKEYTGLSLYDFDVLTVGEVERLNTYKDIMRYYQEYEKSCPFSDQINSAAEEIEQRFSDVA